MKFLFSFLLLFSTACIAQHSDRTVLTSKQDTAWISITKDWKFNVGDDPRWAAPGFNDSLWKYLDLNQDLTTIPEIPNDGHIIWLRRHITTDSTLNSNLVMRIYQTGASQIFLDGKLIHALGNIDSDPKKVTFFSSNTELLSFPLPPQREQVLAIRFAPTANRYPLYSPQFKSYLNLWITSFKVGNNDYIVRYLRTYSIALSIDIGVAMLFFVLYLSLFIFFPRQKINLYYSITNLFFAGFLITFLLGNGLQTSAFFISLLGALTAFLYLQSLLFCTYKIFDKKLDWAFWCMMIIGFAHIPVALLINEDITTLFAVLMLFSLLRISILSLKEHKIGARIILLSVILNLIYWTSSLLSAFGIINIPGIELYVPFAFLIAPLSLGIYLGYIFGKTSQSLSLKLDEVQMLSQEKQEILSAQNEILEKQVMDRTAALNQSLDDLKSTQTQLVQSEKMASLGELTAGIAHEIQNPLNFVNNFSEVNKELIDEMNEEIAKGNYDDVKSIAKDIADNEQKINHHGKRADAIVKGMLQHSRSSNGQKEPTDINELCDEYLRLSYHGLRAKDKSFNATLKTDFDTSLPKINVVPQDLGRVILNLLTNAFYSVNERKLNNASAGIKTLYEPNVSIATKVIENKLQINVADNGGGIPQKVMDKIFQPFFTTKPTGQGTGLGLSMSYDIITKGHNGELKVETKEGEGTTFIITLPLLHSL